MCKKFILLDVFFPHPTLCWGVKEVKFELYLFKRNKCPKKLFLKKKKREKKQILTLGISVLTLFPGCLHDAYGGR